MASPGYRLGSERGSPNHGSGSYCDTSRSLAGRRLAARRALRHRLVAILYSQVRSDKKPMRLLDTQTLEGGIAYLTYQSVRDA
jgi:hypothetical protein